MAIESTRVNKKLVTKQRHARIYCLHFAALTATLGALETLCNLAKEAELNPDHILLVQFEEEFTPLHNATMENNVDLLNYL